MRALREVIIVGTIAVALAWPADGLAKSFCFADAANGRTFVLGSAKLVKGKAAPASGYLRYSSGNTGGVFGSTVVNQQGTAYLVNLMVPNAVLFGGTSSGAGASTLNVAFFQADGRLDVGETGSGQFNSTNVSVTVIDCKTAPPLPMP